VDPVSSASMHRAATTSAVLEMGSDDLHADGQTVRGAVNRPLTQVARSDAPHRLTQLSGVAASVLERAGESLVITSYEDLNGGRDSSVSNERIPTLPDSAWPSPHGT
jgi:hypothetical protein